jgi:uncharacterized membrane protein
VHLGTSIPWWGLALWAVAIAALATFAYRRVGALSRRQRLILTTLRALALAFISLCLLRPMVRVTPADRVGGTVAILIDQSRSMALRDAGGLSRLERAGAISRQLQPLLAARWKVETWLFGDGLHDAHDVALSPTANRSDLATDLSAAVARLAPHGLSGLVVLTDGARTDTADLDALGRQLGVTVVAIGIGRADAADIAIRSVAAGESSLDASLVDLVVGLDARGLPKPFDLRLLQNGRVVERRTLTPAGNGGPLRATFTVAPDRGSPTVYTLDVPAEDGELTAGNNHASVLVPPPGRRRRVLVLEGSPGFEHTFLTRAWSEDPSLDVDSVVRKGRNEQGDDTYFVQAAGARAEALTGGFPASREALYAYDAVVLANLDVRLLPRERLDWLRDFVSVRGGGLLMLGARSFDAQALAGTPIEELLPLRPAESNGIMPVVATSGAQAGRVRVTLDGLRHPMMRIAATDEEASRRWAQLPALAGHVRLGAPRPGASVLAVADGAGGALEPVVASQRFGAGRTLVFTGEASWRWKMMLPASDGTYDRFWRQAARWLTTEAADPVSLEQVTSAATGGGDVLIAASVRDAEFRPAPTATVSVKVERANGAVEELTPTLVDGARARFTARIAAGDAGVNRVHVEALQGPTPLGEADAPWLVGGIEAELADPRLDELALRRLADASGGAYLDVDHALDAGRFLQTASSRRAPEEWRDWWQTGWMFALIVLLAGVEWALRRQWGLK